VSARNGIRIWVEPAATRRGEVSKAWAKISAPPEGGLFSFRDWYDMAQAIGKCEVIRYGGAVAERESWDRWTQFPRQFLIGCFEFEADYTALHRAFRMKR
jgi:hypothetical protein